MQAIELVAKGEKNERENKLLGCYAALGLRWVGRLMAFFSYSHVPLACYEYRDGHGINELVNPASTMALF